MTTPYYSDDHVTLWHGDCIELADLWTCADVLVTDPPYGIDWAPAIGGYKGKGSQSPGPRVAGDATTAIRDTMLMAWGPRPRIVFGSWRAPRPEAVDHRLIWHKQGQAPGPANAAFMLQDEEIYVSGQGFRRSSPPLRSVITTREARSVEVARIGHPTPKPVELMTLLLDRCPPGTIADPFAGSGSTLVAAKALGRKAIGVELEERYCEIAARRLSQDVLDFTEATA